MAEKDTHRVKTLIEFMEWAAQFRGGQYLFRGVSSETYQIKASGYRRLPQLGRSNPNRLLEITKRLIEDARRLGHDQRNGQQLSDLELIAELQHFGAATCLIDFSRSALVALWFACQESSAEERVNGKVYAVRGDDPVRFKTINPELTQQNIDYFFKPDEDNKYRQFQWEPKLQNNRIIAQHSVFVFGPLKIEAGAECLIMEDSKRKAISNKQKILESLNQISDITEASMFPDFDGFARLHAHNKPYNESNAHDYLRRGHEAMKNNNLDDAIAYYTEVINLAPALPGIIVEAYNSRGIAYIDKGEVNRAIDDYSKSIEVNPNLDYVYFNRGNAYHKKGDSDHAIADFTKAVGLNPDFAEAYTDRGNVYHSKKDYTRAIDDHNKAIALNPDYTNAYFNRGVVYKSENNLYRAIADFTKAINLNPNFAGAYNHRGVAYIDEGDYDNAIADFTKAINLNPDFMAEIYYNRALAYHKNGAFDKALIDYTKTVDLNPDFVAEVYYNRGRVWLHRRGWEECVSDLTAATDRGMDINTAFCNDYESIPDFERENGVKLPADIAAMLTPPQA